MTPTMRELLEKVTRCPGPDWIYSIPDLSSIKAEIRSRLTPDTIKAVLEALEGAELLARRATAWAPNDEQRVALAVRNIKRLEAALHLLNGTTQL